MKSQGESASKSTVKMHKKFPVITVLRVTEPIVYDASCIILVKPI